MSKRKYLNLDELVAEPGVIVFQGEEHTVPEMRMKDFFGLLQAQQEAEESGDEIGSMQAAKIMIQKSIPTMTEEILDELTMRQLQGLISFIVETAQGDEQGENPTQE